MSGQTWTSLNHLKNVLSCVNHLYHLPFRPHSNTWKTASITQCLVNTSKNTSRRNPSVRKTPLVFFNSSTCIAVAKSIHKMHVTIFHVGRHKRHSCNSSQATNRHAGSINTAFHSQGHWHCRVTHQLCRLQYLEPQEAPIFSGHYLRNRSTLDIGVLGYIGIL